MKKSSSYLHRHEIYIRRRIDIINDRLSSVEESDTIKSKILYSFINKDYSFAGYYPFDKTPLNELASIHLTWNILSDGDFLGFLYQGLSSLTHKKNAGQYFTPTVIIDHLINSTIDESEDVSSMRILDPACGSGQFLIAVFKKLFSLYTKNGWDEISAKKHIIDKNIFGQDVDPHAIAISRQNLCDLSGHLSSNIHVSDFIPAEESLFSPKKEQLFDLIIGNPPWGSTLSSEQKKFFKTHYESAPSGVNSFTLFIESSTAKLTNKGSLAFLIPDAYLNIKTHMDSRTHVLNNYQIKEIRLWGDLFKNVYAPSSTLILTKQENSEQRDSHIVHILQSNADTALLIPQHYYKTTYQNIFNIHFSQRAETIITKINDRGAYYLENNANFFLGIVTGSNNKFISASPSDSTPDPIVIGKDIDRYRINFSGHYFKYDPTQLQQTAPSRYYKAKGKILYKFIGKRLTFAVDKTGYYTLNNVNGFIPKTDQCTPEYLTALLNSPVLQYYYEKNFFTVKVLRNNLERLPLKILPAAEISRITHLSDIASQSSSSLERQQSIDTINDIFFHAYGISDRDALRMINGATKDDPGQELLF